MQISKKEELIEVELKSVKNKVRCSICNQFTKNIHSNLKSIRNTYLDSCGQKVVLIIHKRRFCCYNCNTIFTRFNFQYEILQSITKFC